MFHCEPKGRLKTLD